VGRYFGGFFESGFLDLEEEDLGKVEEEEDEREGGMREERRESMVEVDDGTV
jgi:hypothetical protein